MQAQQRNLFALEKITLNAVNELYSNLFALTEQIADISK
jgi:hypothetical protein